MIFSNTNTPINLTIYTQPENWNLDKKNNNYPVFNQQPSHLPECSFGIYVSNNDEIKVAKEFFDKHPLSEPHMNFLYLNGDICRQTDILQTASETNYFIVVEKGSFLSPDDIKRMTAKLTHKNFALVECGSSFGYATRVLDPRSLFAMREASPYFGVCLTDLLAPDNEQYPHRPEWISDDKFLESYKIASQGFSPHFFVYKEKSVLSSELVSENKTPLVSSWDRKITDDITIYRDKLTVIAGPCMLETLELGIEVGSFMKQLCAEKGYQYIFKSSFDKANRTSAGGIRGPGLDQGLDWLKHIKNELQVPTLTDVHNAEHARRAAEVVDVLQIPAFLFRDKVLLKACADTGKTIQIKKGQWASAQDMLNMAAFLAEYNCHNIIFAERGSCFGYNNLSVDFRNLVDMAKYGHAVVYDATHSVQLPGAKQGKSSGLRDMVPALTRAARAVGIDGLFMEVHPNPEKALSDADTQLSFEMAREIFRLL